MVPVVLFLLLYFLTAICVAYAIFSPILNIPTVHSKDRVRLQLVDMFAAPLPFAIFFAAFNWFLADIGWYPLLAIVVVLAVALAFLAAFVCGMRVLSRMNVRSGLKRVAILGLVMPLGFVMSATSILVVLSADSVQHSFVRLTLVIGIVVCLRGLASWVRPKTSSLQAHQDREQPVL